MREPPPPRYKVVERGRRLEVIDTWNGNAPVVHTPHPPSAPSARPVDARVSAPSAPQIDARGRRRFTTSSWYDAKGPRVLLLDADGERQLDNARAVLVAVGIAVVLLGFLWWPLLIMLGIVAGQPKARNNLRKAGAGWLDSIDAGEG